MIPKQSTGKKSHLLPENGHQLAITYFVDSLTN
jgi:hypothetical protein